MSCLQECHCHNSHLLPDPVHQGAGADSGEAEDGGFALSHAAIPSGQVAANILQNDNDLYLFRDIQLKKRVNAEKIENVTVYYSDLVNFTEIYSDSTPFEV